MRRKGLFFIEKRVIVFDCNDYNNWEVGYCTERNKQGTTDFSG